MYIYYLCRIKNFCRFLNYLLLNREIMNKIYDTWLGFELERFFNLAEFHTPIRVYEEFLFMFVRWPIIDPKIPSKLSEN